MAYCCNCGKEFEKDVKFCPHCGANQYQNVMVVPPQETPQITQAPQEKKLNVFALIGFILSLVSLFLSIYGIMGVAAAIFSTIGYIQVNENNEKGKGFAITGIVLGSISVLYEIFTLLFLESLLSYFI